MVRCASAAITILIWAAANTGRGIHGLAGLAQRPAAGLRHGGVLDAASQWPALGGDTICGQPLMDMAAGSDYCSTGVALCGSQLAMATADGWPPCLNVREAASERHVVKSHADDKGQLEVALQPFCTTGPQLVVATARCGRVSMFDARWSIEQPVSSFATWRHTPAHSE